MLHKIKRPGCTLVGVEFVYRDSYPKNASTHKGGRIFAFGSSR